MDSLDLSIFVKQSLPPHLVRRAGVSGRCIQYTGTAAGVGTGATQTILGNASLNFTQNWGTNIYENSTLGTAGTYTDNLTYTLTF